MNAFKLTAGLKDPYGLNARVKVRPARLLVPTPAVDPQDRWVDYLKADYEVTPYWETWDDIRPIGKTITTASPPLTALQIKDFWDHLSQFQWPNLHTYRSPPIQSKPLVGYRHLVESHTFRNEETLEEKLEMAATLTSEYGRQWVLSPCGKYLEKM